MIVAAACALTAAVASVAAVLWTDRCRQLGIPFERALTPSAARAVWQARREPARKTRLTPAEIDAAYRAAIIQTIDRYRAFPSDDPKLAAFMDEITDGCRSGLPLLKLNRWLGYVQGTLIERGLTTVAHERDATRPLFRHLDFPEG